MSGLVADLEATTQVLHFDKVNNVQYKDSSTTTQRKWINLVLFFEPDSFPSSALLVTSPATPHATLDDRSNTN